MTVNIPGNTPDWGCQSTTYPLPQKKIDTFDTGSKRENQSEKIRFDLIPILPLIRLANRYGGGEKTYGVDNWKLGQSYRRTCASLLRHIFLWILKDNSEDHLAAVAWGAFTLMQYEHDIENEKLPVTLDDRPW